MNAFCKAAVLLSLAAVGMSGYAVGVSAVRGSDVNDHQRKMARKSREPSGYHPDAYLQLADAGQRAAQDPAQYDSWRFGKPQMETVPDTEPLLQQDHIDAALKRSPEYWKRTWEGATRYDTKSVDKGIPGGEGVQGYTVCDKPARNCNVVMRSNARNYDEVHQHEKMHVMGYDHPGYGHSLGAPLPSILERQR
ncbi:MAG: hypothetical protein OEW90_00965 [Betaproteobacteria bacterium]|nr:hypothetical protein [Betaproteobacteria bacterium]MDH4322688.1 hypothetical protein [Betaproteobacteria bacterium]